MKTLFKPFRTILALGIITFLTSSSLLAETGSVQGSVVDAKSQEIIEAASVELLNKADSSLVKGIITNPDGTYAFNNVPIGDYILRFSCMGYNVKANPAFSLTNEKPTVKFTQTTLAQSSLDIEEVSVYGRMLTGTMEDDKTIYNVTEEAAEISTSGLELLRQVPDVNVDYVDNDVTLEGSTNILFLVNGKKVDKDYLKQLNPKLIERYEIVTNPGVKYDADVDGVINVVLKRDFAHGISGRVNVEVPTSNSSYFSYSNANIDYYRNGLRLFINGYGGGNNWDIEMERKRQWSTDTTSNELQRYTDYNPRRVYAGASYGFDWFINDKNTLNFFSSISPRTPLNYDATSNNYTYTTHNSTNNVDTLWESEIYNNYQENFYNDYSLYYQRKLDKEGHDFSVEMFYSSNNQTQDLTTTDSVVYPDPSNKITNQFSDNNKDMIRAKIDYNVPLASWLNLSAGGTNVNTLFDNYQTNNSNQNYNLKYNEYRFAGYTNFSATLDKHNIQTGVRYESSNINIENYSNTSNDTAADGNYNEFLPYFSYNTKLGTRHSFRLNYRRSITRPGMSQVNPFTSRDDQYNSSAGNPALKPSKSQKIELSHRIKIHGPLFINYRPFVRYQNDVIYRVSTTDENGVLNSKFENVSERFSYGVGVNANIAFVKWWMIIPNFNWTHIDITEDQRYGIKNLNEDAFTWGIRNNFVLPKEIYLFVNYFNNGTQYDYQSVNHTQDVIVAGFNKQINKNWGVTAFTVNPFSNKYYTNDRTTSDDTYVETNLSTINYSHIFNIKVSYTFNKGKEGKKLNRSVDGDNEAVKGGGMF